MFRCLDYSRLIADRWSCQARRVLLRLVRGPKPVRPDGELFLRELIGRGVGRCAVISAANHALATFCSHCCVDRAFPVGCLQFTFLSSRSLLLPSFPPQAAWRRQDSTTPHFACAFAVLRAHRCLGHPLPKTFALPFPCRIQRPARQSGRPRFQRQPGPVRAASLGLQLRPRSLPAAGRDEGIPRGPKPTFQPAGVFCMSWCADLEFRGTR